MAKQTINRRNITPKAPARPTAPSSNIPALRRGIDTAPRANGGGRKTGVDLAEVQRQMNGAD